MARSPNFQDMPIEAFSTYIVDRRSRSAFLRPIGIIHSFCVLVFVLAFAGIVAGKIVFYVGWLLGAVSVITIFATNARQYRTTTYSLRSGSPMIAYRNVSQGEGVTEIIYVDEPSHTYFTVLYWLPPSLGV